MHAGRAIPGPYTNAAGTSITDASTARTVKVLGYFFPADMRDDSAVYGAISTKLHVDAEHIAREPAPPGIRMVAVQCIIGSARRHHARGIWAPTLDQARRTQVHLCRLVVRVVLAVPVADPIKLTGDSGTAPELLLPCRSRREASLCHFSSSVSSCATAVSTIADSALPSTCRLSKGA